jgi:hypothetical protein
MTIQETALVAEKVLERRLSLEGRPMGTSLSRSRRTRWSYQFLIGVSLLLRPGRGPKRSAGNEDNSFLIEEAYNQEQGGGAAYQHVLAHVEQWGLGLHLYAGMASPRVPAHQLSYTLVAAHARRFDTGWGRYDSELSLSASGEWGDRTRRLPRALVYSCHWRLEPRPRLGGVGVQTSLP